MRTSILVLALLGASLVAPSLALAQETPAQRSPAEWAPRWEVGDWWEVELYQKDLQRRLASPHAAAEPKALPGFPVLRGGVPRGYKKANRFRFEVLRKLTHRWPGEPALDTPPEEFWVVSMRTLEGKTRKAELWFSTRDLSLSKVVTYRTRRGVEVPRERWLSGTAQLDLAVSRELGFPLAWPDLHAAKATTTRFGPHGRRGLEQRARVEVKEGSKETLRTLVYLRESVPPGKKTSGRSRCRFVFTPDQRFWTQLATNDYVGLLHKSGKRGEK
jgi:hypothetical protein